MNQPMDINRFIRLESAVASNAWGKPYPSWLIAMQATVDLHAACGYQDLCSLSDRRERWGAQYWRNAAVDAFSVAVRDGLICC